MPTKDDEYWHRVMHALGDEFIEKGERAGDNPAGWSHAWVEAGREVKATADQALKTNTVAERLRG